MSRQQIILGTRGSRLALTQADMVKEAMTQACPGLEVEIKVIETTGDRRTDLPLDQVAKVAGVFDKGIFLKELEQALETGEIDFAVHSLKDVPSELDGAFELAAVLSRAAIEDVLVSKTPQLNAGAHIATGSVRRRKMAERLFDSETRFSDLRGNVPTRLSKLAANHDLDAVILAKAGLDRLGLYASESEVDGEKIYMSILDKKDFVPAAGQGIIGIEIRSNDEPVKKLVSLINHHETHLCARAEREYLRLLGADCSTPVGSHAWLDEKGETMHMTVMLYEDHSNIPIVRHVSGAANAPEELAAKLLQG